MALQAEAERVWAWELTVGTGRRDGSKNDDTGKMKITL